MVLVPSIREKIGLRLSVTLVRKGNAVQALTHILEPISGIEDVVAPSGSMGHSAAATQMPFLNLPGECSQGSAPWEGLVECL